MEMIPPALKNALAKQAAMENENNLISKCLGASMGDGRTTSRLPVKRRLFGDESPENSPPDLSLDVKIEKLYSSEKERMRNEYGFDIGNESPSTSKSSNFEWTMLRASEVPNFYIRAHGPNSNAAFSPKSKNRFGDSIDSPPRHTTTAVSIFDTSSSIDEEITKAETSSTIDIGSAITKKHVEATPLKTGSKKKKPNSSNVVDSATISRQKRLTDFYDQRKKRAATGSSPTKNRKRPAPSEAGDTSSNVIRL